MVGEQISHYRIESKLGSGTYGVVYKAAHIDDLELTVAIKVVQPSLLDDPRFLESLKAECRRLNKLDHSGIVRFRELVVREGQVAMVLELLEGKDLHDTIQAGPMPLAQAQEVIETVLGALAYAHSKEVIHRDIKPSNIFLCDDGRVKILDFGIARAAQNTQATQTGTMKGTLDYMAPERFSAGGGGPHSDVYAVGLVAWELVAGRTACPEGDLPEKLGWHLGVGPVDLKTVRPDCPDWFAGLVSRMSSRDLKLRPTDGAAALADMATARASAPASDRADTQVPVLAPGTVSVQREAVAEALREIANTPTRAAETGVPAAPVPAPAAPSQAPARPAVRPPAASPPTEPTQVPPMSVTAPVKPGVNLGLVAALVIGALVLGGGGVGLVALGIFASSSGPEKTTGTTESAVMNKKTTSTTESAVVNKALNGLEITRSELSSQSCETLWRVRNWAFARHGRTFESSKGKRYFNSHPRYRRSGSYSETDLSRVDKANMRLARKLEGQNGCR